MPQGVAIKYEKPFLSYAEQADLLVGRGLITERDELVGTLERVGYYRLSGYLYPYRQPDGTYREGTTLSEVWGRYMFDRQFRLVVLDAIERIEVWFRSQLAGEDASAKVAESWLVTLNTVRNYCAHHGRLRNKTLGTKPMIPRDNPDWHDPHEVCNHKMFGTLTILSRLLETVAPDTSWRSRLLALMKERLPHRDWYAMGLGDGWEKCPIWSKWLANDGTKRGLDEEDQDGMMQ